MRPRRTAPAVRFLSAAALVSALLGAAAPASAGLLEGPLSNIVGTDAVPACDDPSVIADVQERFATGAYGMLQADLALVAVDKVRQTHPLASTPSPTTRRYCAARGHVSNGRTAPVYFLVEQRQGFVGLGWLVTSCVNGYDRWQVNDGACRTVRKWW
jgi:hypothetical protein